MRLKVKERTQKYWAMVSDLLCRTLITQECCTILKGNRPLPMKCRTRLYIAGVVVGIFLLLLSLPFLLCVPFLRDNDVFQSALAVLILTFPSVTINWFIKNRDKSRQLEYSSKQLEDSSKQLEDSSKQLEDSSKQLEDSSKQQNETLFSNSLQLLLRENDIAVKSIGLKELVKLKQEGKIDPKRIDLITYSGLKIEGANLQEAWLQEANLRRARLHAANLQKANLQGANLEEAKLEGSYYDNETIFSDGFDPKQHGMILV